VVPAPICGFAAAVLLGCPSGSCAGTDEVQITHIAKDLLRR
jgi:hypothetical protein